MIGTSLLDYIHIWFWIIVLRAITPLCFIYCIFRPFFFLPLLPLLPILLIFDVWAVTEVCFYLFVYLPLKRRSQGPVIHPSLTLRKDRKLLFAKCHDAMTNPEDYLQKWFLNAPMADIKRDNVKEFFSWAFLDTGAHRLEDEQELEEYVDSVEVLLGRSLAPGRGKAKCLRLTLDGIDMLHRPLFWYMVNIPPSGMLAHLLQPLRAIPLQLNYKERLDSIELYRTCPASPAVEK